MFSARFVRGDREILAASTDGSLRVWDAMTGQLRQRYFGSDQYSFDATLAPDGQTIVSAGSDGILRFWDAASATLMWTLRAHRGGITGIHFEGDNVVTRGSAGELSRWDFSKLPSRQAIDGIVRCLPLRFDDETGRVVEQQGCDAP
jgi:WD40 repeat protein